MAKLTVQVEVAEREHYTTADLQNLKSTLKRDGEKFLLVDDLLRARKQRDAAQAAVQDERTAKEVDRYVLKMYKEDEARLRAQVQQLAAERASARALFVEVMPKYAAAVLGELASRQAATNATALAEQLKQDLTNAIAERDEITQERDALGAVALHNKALGEEAFSERDEALACARREIVKRIFTEIQLDHARAWATRAIAALGEPAAIIVPFAGEPVASYGAPDSADDQTCACGQTNSDEPCDVECAMQAAADARNEAAKAQVHGRVFGEDVVNAANTGKDGGAAHFDGGKLSFNNVPEEGERALVEVFSYGERKYGFRNWEKKPGLTALQYYGSMRRHLQDWRASIDTDPESGLPHLAHVAANALMCLVTLKNDPATDNRKAPR